MEIIFYRMINNDLIFLDNIYHCVQNSYFILQEMIS